MKRQTSTDRNRKCDEIWGAYQEEVRSFDVLLLKETRSLLCDDLLNSIGSSNIFKSTPMPNTPCQP